MQRNTEVTTKPIRFWSEGNMARGAFNRIENLRSNDRSKEARSMLDEWIIDQKDLINL